ncbi:hypothetical protein EG703_04640 [Salmonella enterica]|nr:hypothetical protein [Salmonella enterica]
MQKFKLLVLPVLAFIGPTIMAVAYAKTTIPTSQQSVSKSEVNYEFLTIAAKYVDGVWLVDGQKRPVIKTSMTKRNYLQIENQSALTPLNLVIPKIAFDVIAKNGVFLSKVVSLDEDASGKKILWLEPDSSLTISFVNDLSSTPLQAIVSVTKLKNDVIAIFGPDRGRKFTLPLPENSQQSSKEFIPSPEVALRLSVPKKRQTDTTISDDVIAFLSPLHTYEIKATEKIRSLKFSEFVWVDKRNDFLVGSEYFTKKLTVYPGESFEISTTRNTTMRAKHD